MNGWVIYDPGDTDLPVATKAGWFFKDSSRRQDAPEVFNDIGSAAARLHSMHYPVRERAMVVRFEELPEQLKDQMILAIVTEKIR